MNSLRLLALAPLFLVALGCGPSEATKRVELKASQDAATARLESFKREKASELAEAKESEERQKLGRILAPYTDQAKRERAAAAFDREWVRQGNELADRQGR